MDKIKKAIKSVRVKLFLTLSLVILLIIVFLILVNNFVFGQFYLYSKTKELKLVYKTVNEYYDNQENINLSAQLERMAINAEKLGNHREYGAGLPKYPTQDYINIQIKG